MNKLSIFIKTKLWRYILLVIIMISLILIILSVYYYWESYHSNSISSSPQDWGVFGDYFGGTLNPLFSLISICVTIWLAVIVNKINNNQIVTSRKIALTQLKHEALKELRVELNENFDVWRNNHNNIAHPTTCIRTLNNFATNYDYLFDLFTVDSFGTLNNILNNAVFTIHNNPNGITVSQNFMQANAGRQVLLADLGARTLQ
jgi:hypothetical protein